VAWGSVFDGAGFELAVKALTLVLLAGGAAVLWELIRYLRTLRLERDLARRITMQAVYGSANDPRIAEPVRAVPRGSVFGRLLRGWFQAVGAVTVVLLVCAVAAAPFLSTWLEQHDHPEKADYIVALPGDNGRIVKAANLYKQGFAPRILLGGEVASSDADLYEAQSTLLEREGVPRALTTRLAPPSVTIAGLAEALRTFADGRRLRLIVVVPAIASLRTRVVLEDVVPRARFIVVAVDDGTIENPWWNSTESAARTLAEATQLVRYLVVAGVRSLQFEPETVEAKGSPPLATRPAAPPKPSESLGAGAR
jgi:uncharacterized SAM-binding protein YcdF (DUF218 family)